MTRFSHDLIVLVLFIFMTAGCQTMTGETAGQRLDATTITTSVKSQLATEDRLGTLTQIHVTTVGNTVYLTGAVPYLEEKNRAEDIARHVNGVKSVVNNIDVQP